MAESRGPIGTMKDERWRRVATRGSHDRAGRPSHSPTDSALARGATARRTNLIDRHDDVERAVVSVFDPFARVADDAPSRAAVNGARALDHVAVHVAESGGPDRHRVGPSKNSVANPFGWRSSRRRTHGAGVRAWVPVCARGCAHGGARQRTSDEYKQTQRRGRSIKTDNPRQR